MGRDLGASLSAGTRLGFWDRAQRSPSVREHWLGWWLVAHARPGGDRAPSLAVPVRQHRMEKGSLPEGKLARVTGGKETMHLNPGRAGDVSGAGVGDDCG